MGYGMNRNNVIKDGNRYNKAWKGKKTIRPVQSFHLKLKHLLAGVSFLSLFAAFEVFSIPAANYIMLYINMIKIISR